MTEEEQRPELGFNPHKLSKHGRPAGTLASTPSQLRDAPRAGLTSADRNRQAESHMVLLVERRAAVSSVPVDYTAPHDPTVRGKRRPADSGHKTGLVSDVPAQPVTRVVRPQNSQLSVKSGMLVGVADSDVKHVTPARRAESNVSKIFAPPPAVVVDRSYRPEAPFFTGGEFS
jgi:hypothetical protein